MNVYELKQLLEDCDEEAEVRFASQPSWPLEYAIIDVLEFDRDKKGNILPSFHNVREHVWKDSSEPESFDDSNDEEVVECSIVYLVEGDQIGYLPGEVSNSLGWR